MKIFYRIILVLLVFFQMHFFYGMKNNSTFISIKDFGAVGDGIKDDSEAIQKAIDYCESTKRKTLFIPFGRYLLKKSVIFNDGGVQLMGEGALLREESWINDNEVNIIDSSEFLIARNIAGIVYSESVKDPVRIIDIQFSAADGRLIGDTVGILFKSEFAGPTWPFIIERCRFSGFNYAIKFISKSQYLVAFIQMRQNAFNQNDECVYFGNIDEPSKTGIRNLAWGFTFENNVCHDNSRIIRGSFAKDQVNILNNNMEGNIVYSNGSKPQNIIDIEVSNVTVNFEGNHFESIISDAVYISSVFHDNKGKVLPVIGTTAFNPKNKIFIKGNNFDGVLLHFKPFILKGLLVYNYDQVELYLDSCDVRINESNKNNIHLTEFAKKTGTVIKFPIRNTISFIKSKKKFLSGNANFEINRYSKSRNYSNVKRNAIGDNTKLLGVSIKIFNENGVEFFGLRTCFELEYKLEGKIVNSSHCVAGNYGFILGESVNIAVIPNPLPLGSTEAFFFAEIQNNENILGNMKVWVKKAEYFQSKDVNIVFSKKNVK